MMDQFVVWEMRNVRYLCVRIDPLDCFVEQLKRLPNATH